MPQCVPLPAPVFAPVHAGPPSPGLPAAPSRPFHKVTESMAEEYDVVVLGSGEAGKYLAWTLASQGQKVAVIERRYVGGSCPNIACLPSKNVIHSAKVASYFRRSEEFGLAKDGWRIDAQDGEGR
jgi:Pyridine nucleotide-disulphide oxidoreductase